jgi:hypothetical protein
MSQEIISIYGTECLVCGGCLSAQTRTHATQVHNTRNKGAKVNIVRAVRLVSSLLLWGSVKSGWLGHSKKAEELMLLLLLLIKKDEGVLLQYSIVINMCGM